MRLMERYFDDLNIGDSETSPRRTVTEADVTMWCMFTGDWFPIHCDKVYAEESMFKQRVAPGVMVMAMAGGLVVPAQTETVIANYGTDRLRYPNPTFLGDTIHVVATVDSLKSRDDKTGIADLKWEIFKQDGKMVCSLILRVLVKTRAADASAKA
ncbi:MAG: MaoC family dehydratase N-terminal domain-containing protein [Rhodobacteraceae bacterium]|nr:MaoC family dehydratase N-terminal domain-containing protein [Paracoccaceae bacterium]